MRPLEWCLILAFLPLILMAFGPPAWRRSWPLFSIFPAVVALLQVALEGWRWQLIPLYLLAAAIPLVALLRRSKPPYAGRAWQPVSALTGVVLGCGRPGCVGLAGHHAARPNRALRGRRRRP